MKVDLVVCLSAALATLGGTNVALADVLTETQSVANSELSPFFTAPDGGEYTFAHWSPTINFAQFDPSLGSLASATILVQTGMTNVLGLTGDSIQHLPEALGGCTYSLEWQASITSPGSTVFAPDPRLGTGTISRVLQRGVTSSFTVPPTGGSVPSTYTVDPADFAIYSGTGTVPLSLTFDAQFSCSQRFQCVVTDRVNSRATLTVEYDYTPVPSPNSAALLVLGPLLDARRRRLSRGTDH